MTVATTASAGRVVKLLGDGALLLFPDADPCGSALRAVGPATVYSMKPDAFESLLDKHPHIVYGVMRALFRITHANLMRMNQESQELVNYVSKVRGRY